MPRDSTQPIAEPPPQNMPDDANASSAAGTNSCVPTQADRDKVTLEQIRPLALMAAVAYTIIGIGHLLMLPAGPREIMTLAAIGIVALTLGIYAAARAGRVTLAYANPIMFVFAICLIGSASLHVVTTGEIHQVTNLGLSIGFLGLFFLSIPYMAASFGLGLAAWFAIVHPTISDPLMGHFGFFLLISCMLTVVAFTVRWRAHNKLIAVQKHASVREAVLATALERARLAEAATSEEQAKRAFVSNTSHELRTPLNAIIGFSDVLDREMFGPVGSDENRDYVREINSSGQTLLRLLNDILDLASVSLDEYQVSEHDFDLAALVRRCVALATSRDPLKGIAVTASVPDALTRICSDERRIKQMLMHLLSNAIKFNKQGGWVKVSAGLASNGWISIRVSDSGVGMSEEDIRHAFSPFWQGSRELSRSHGGLGVGIGITAAIAARLDGRLEIESDPGHGTRATIWLPPHTVATDDKTEVARSA